MSYAEKRTVSLLEKAIYQGAHFDVSEEKESPAKIKAWGLGVLRGFFFYEYCCQALLKRGTDRTIQVYLMMAMFRLDERPKESALLTNTLVESAKKMHISGSLVNAVLRLFLMKRKDLDVKARGRATIQYNMRPSLLDRLKSQQEGWREVVRYMQQRPEVVLRVNAEKAEEETFFKALTEARIEFVNDGRMVVLKGGARIREIPGYIEGWFTVVSESNQKLLSILPSMSSPKVLDACAAPGGKSFLLREKYGRKATILSTDIDPNRVSLLEDNNKRLGLNLHISQRDWSKERPDEVFDLIWADVPCSATGVISKHPEVAVYERDDMQNIVLQQNILKNLWQSVAPGGYLVYTTCSILEEENSGQIQEFLRENLDACVVHEEERGLFASSFGAYMTSDNSRDIIYVCKIKKSDR